LLSANTVDSNTAVLPPSCVISLDRVVAVVRDKTTRKRKLYVLHSC